jgi:hypothetical protein
LGNPWYYIREVKRMEVSKEITIQIDNYIRQCFKKPNAVFLNPTDYNKLKEENNLIMGFEWGKKVFGIDIYVSQDFKGIRVGNIFF